MSPQSLLPPWSSAAIMSRGPSPEGYAIPPASAVANDVSATLSSEFLFQDLWEEDDDPPSPCGVRNRYWYGVGMGQEFKRQPSPAAPQLQQQRGLQPQHNKQFQAQQEMMIAMKQIENRQQPLQLPSLLGNGRFSPPGSLTGAEKSKLTSAPSSTCTKSATSSLGSAESGKSPLSSFGTPSWGSPFASERSDAPQAVAWNRNMSNQSIGLGNDKKDEEDDDDMVGEDSDLDDVDVVVGPLEAYGKLPTAATFYKDDNQKNRPASFKSMGGKIYLSDCLTLKKLSVGRVLSFGSARHAIEGKEDRCRPCRFERHPGKCKRGLSCDFCHLHERRRT